MLRSERIPESVELACGRIDELISRAGPELGRWMIAVAERYAAGSCRCRTLKAASLHPSSLRGSYAGASRRSRPGARR